MGTELLLRALDQMNQAVIVISAEGIVVYLNRSAQVITQWPLAEAGGKRFENVIGLVDDQGKQLPAPNGLAFGSGAGRLVNRYHAEIPVCFSTQSLGGDGQWMFTASLIPLPASGAAAGDSVPAVVEETAWELGSRAEGEQAIRICVEQGQRKFAVIFSTQRLELYRSRNGLWAALRLKAIYARQLAKALERGDGLYDWSPSRILVLMERRGEDAHTLRQQMHRVATRRVDCALKESSGIISLQSECTITPLFGDQSAEDLIAQLDEAGSSDSRDRAPVHADY